MPLILQIEAKPISREEYELCPRRDDKPYDDFVDPYIITKVKIDKDIAIDYKIPNSYHNIRIYREDIWSWTAILRKGEVLSLETLKEAKKELNSIRKRIYDQKFMIYDEYRRKKELRASNKPNLEVIYF